MSAKATFWAWERRVNDATSKLVLLSLADRANEKNECWPSLATIAVQTHLSTRAVSRAIRYLTRNKFILSEVRTRSTDPGRSSNLYTILVDSYPSGPEKPEKKLKKPIKRKRKNPTTKSLGPHGLIGDTAHDCVSRHEPKRKEPNDFEPQISLKKKEFKVQVKIQHSVLEPEHDLVTVLDPRDQSSAFSHYGTRTAYWPD